MLEVGVELFLKIGWRLYISIKIKLLNLVIHCNFVAQNALLEGELCEKLLVHSDAHLAHL